MILRRYRSAKIGKTGKKKTIENITWLYIY